MTNEALYCVCPLTGPHLSNCPLGVWEDDLDNLWKSSSLKSWRGCEHAQESVTLFDGTEVFASAHMDRQLRDREPDLAVWLDHSWRADVPSLVIDWQDYGLPSLSIAQFLYVARLALTEARGGLMVETGCVGGHGRTGTMLACLDVLASGPQADAKDSIAYIRRSYCKKAVETKEQAWWVECVAATVLGVNLPPKPYVPPVKKTQPKTNVVTIDGLTGKVTSKRTDGKTFTYYNGAKGPKKS